MPIWQMMHSHSFDAIYDIDDCILDCPIPSLLLQPLAEEWELMSFFGSGERSDIRHPR